MMECERFEREALMMLERGEPLEPHFETCEDCRRKREIYSELVARLASLGAEDRPPAGYEARILERIASEQDHGHPQSTNPRRMWWLASAMIAAALLVTLTMWLVREIESTLDPPALQASLTIEVVDADGGPIVRGDGSAKPGDRILVHAVTGNLPHAELRIWRGSELIERCTDTPPCRPTSGAIEAEF